MVKLIVSALGSARAKAVVALTAIAAMASMALASVASAEGTLIEPAVKKAETEFTANLPVILVLVGLITAATLVIVFFRKHAKKG